MQERNNILSAREYYVYVLMDSSTPITNDPYGLEFEPIYVGKGTGGRDAVHEYNAYQKNYSHNPRLLKRLLDIKKKGGEVVRKRIFTSTDEEAVYEIEKKAIIHYGMQHKGGLLLNAGTGKAGGWGADLNPTYARMKAGTHNFQLVNPIFASVKLVKLKSMIENTIRTNSPTNIVSESWLEKTGYSTTKALTIGISRIISRDNLPVTLRGINLIPF